MRQLKGANVIVQNKQSQFICHLFDEHLDIKRRQTADTNLLINRTFRMQQRRNWTTFEGWSTKNRLFSTMYKVIVWGINEGCFFKGELHPLAPLFHKNTFYCPRISQYSKEVR